MSRKQTAVFIALDILGVALVVMAIAWITRCTTARADEAQHDATRAPTEEAHASDAEDEPGMSGSVQEDIDDPRETYVLLAVLCFNEASGNEQDCKAIGNIRLRYARSRGISLREALLQLHTERREAHPDHAALRTYRATNPSPTDSRPWLGDVRADLHQPLGWSGTASEWARTARAFERLFFIAQGVEAGAIRDTCVAAPIGWGGPIVDASRLTRERLRAQGRELVTCHGTHNAYYRRVPRPTTSVP